MKPKKTKDYVNRSIRMPDHVWNSVKRIAGKNYRSLNSQFIKIVEKVKIRRNKLCSNAEKTYFNYIHSSI